MNTDDLSRFCSMMNGLCEYYQRPALNKTTMDIYWDGLNDHPLDTVSKAIRAHTQDPQAGSYFPKIADIVRHIPTATKQHPLPDEAWLIACDAADEAATVVWTREIAQAWGQVQAVWETRDKVGVRMAFKAVYERLVKQAGAPVWEVSAGFDPQARAVAVENAVAVGRLPSAELLATYALPAPTQGVAGLLEAAKELGEKQPDTAKAAIEAIRRLLEGPSDDKRAAEKAAARDDLERRRADQLRRFDEYQCKKQQAKAA
jgi:hypothetical protein